VRPVRGGNEDHYEAFFRTVFPKALAVARRVTGDRVSAEDAAIEAMAKAHVRWKRVGPAPWREMWALRVAVNEAIRRLPRRALPPMPTWEPTVHREAGQSAKQSDPAEEVVLRQALTAALRRLPRRQREVVVFRYLVGLTESQVAETLDISHGTVKTHLRRAIAELRKNMDQNLKEEHLASLA